MTSRASIGFFGLYEGEACTNQGFISVIPKHQYSKMYLLHNLMRRVEEIKGLAGGTTFKEINKTTFRAMDIVLPEEGVRNEFEEFAYDIIRQVRIIKKQTKKLEEARDLLLPRLMNGDIAV
jgi:type I restriction enzyme S subunit